jgi:pimeloyl-ACP methyl ester carboxylesterase
MTAGASRTVVRHRTVPANRINVHLAEAGNGPLIVLLHGFPELWYSWRHQLLPLATAGYHVVAPDLRGYGRTTAPAAVVAYCMRELVADIVGLLDALGAPAATLVGHDWGAQIAWACAQLHPERFPAIVALSVPYQPRPPIPLTQQVQRWTGDRFNWLLHFQESGVAEAELEADARRSLRLILYGLSGDAPADLPMKLLTQLPASTRLLDAIPEPDRLPPWLTAADLSYYAQEFDRTGFTGALNRYRCVDHDWHDLPQLGETVVEQPTLFVTGERDPASRLMSGAPMRAHVPALREPVVLPGCGHWVQQERADTVTAMLVDFLDPL